MSTDPFAGPSMGQPSLGPTSGDEALPSHRYDDATALGTGGMGRVESVTDRHLDRQVARKTVLDASLVPRLLREARLTARLDHPNIVGVHDVGTGDDGLPYYTMRLVRGRSLAACVHDEGPGIRWVDAVHATAVAVAYAHSQGVVHRDLKPDNIMVGPRGEVVVVDWGLATTVGDVDDATGVSSPGTRLTRVGEVIGTPGFMAPEQARSEPTSEKADIYSLGRILAVTLGPDLQEHAELAAVVERACQTAPDARYASADELAADLDAWRHGHRVSAHDYALTELLQHRLRAARPWLVRGGIALTVSLVVLGALITQVVVEGRRAERAERQTRTALAETLAEQAEQALAAGDLPGARSLVQRSLDATPVPRAMGVAMALPAEGRTTVVAEPGCEQAQFHPSDGTVLCIGEDVSLLDAAGTVLARHARPITVGFGHDGLLGFDEHGVFELGGGRVRSNDTPAGRFTVPIAGLQAATVDSRVAHLLQDGIVTRVLCPERAALLDLVPIGTGWVATCNNGFVMRGEANAVVDTVEVSDRRLSAVAVVHDRFVLGTMDHELLLTDASGAVSTVLLPDAGPVRRIRTSPSGERVLASTNSGRHFLVRVQDGAILGALDAADAHFTDEHTVAAAGPTLTHHTLPDQPSWVMAPHGIGSLAVWRGDLWIGTGEGAVSRWAPDGLHNKPVAEGTVKRLLPVGDALYAALSLDGTFRTTGDGWERLGTAMTRDLQALPDGVRSFSYGGRGRDFRATASSGFPVDIEQHLQVDATELVRHQGDRITLDGTELGRFDGPMALGGGHAAAANRRNVTVWDRTGAHQAAFTTDTRPTAMAIDAERIVLGFMDGTVEVRRIDGDVLAVARVHRERVSALQLHEGVLYSGGWDRRVQRWELGLLESAL